MPQGMRSLAVALLSLFTTLPAFPAAGPAEWNLPTYAFEMKAPEVQEARVAMSVSSVDNADETAFIEWIVTERKNQLKAGVKFETLAPITLLAREGDQRLAGRLTELEKMKIFAIAVPESIAKLARNEVTGKGDLASTLKHAKNQKRQVATEWSLDGVRSAGTYVALSCGTVYSGIFFATQDVGAAAIGTVLTFTLQMIGNKYAQQQLRFFNAGGEVAVKAAEKLKTLSEKGKATVHEIGRWVNGYLYNYAASAAFTLALGKQPVLAQLADWPTLATTVAVTAATGMFSDNSWDMGFANQMAEAEAKGDLKRVKTLILMKYTKSVVMTVISPFMFLEPTRPVAIQVLAAAGFLGLTARAWPEPFVNAAEKGIAALEKSTLLNGLLEKLASRRLPAPARSCRQLFAAAAIAR